MVVPFYYSPLHFRWHVMISCDVSRWNTLALQGCYLDLHESYQGWHYEHNTVILELSEDPEGFWEAGVTQGFPVANWQRNENLLRLEHVIAKLPGCLFCGSFRFCLRGHLRLSLSVLPATDVTQGYPGRRDVDQHRTQRLQAKGTASSVDREREPDTACGQQDCTAERLE